MHKNQTYLIPQPVNYWQIIPAGTARDVNSSSLPPPKTTETQRHTSPTERQQLLLKIADRLEAEKERFATLESLDNGKPYNEAISIDLPPIDHFRYFAGLSAPIPTRPMCWMKHPESGDPRAARRCRSDYRGTSRC